MQLHATGSYSNPAITVIKKPSPDVKTPPQAALEEIEKQMEQKRQQVEAIFSSSGQKTAPQMPAANTSTTGGITKINKYPTEEEKKTMKAQQILLW